MHYKMERKAGFLSNFLRFPQMQLVTNINAKFWKMRYVIINDPILFAVQKCPCKVYIQI